MLIIAFILTLLAGQGFAEDTVGQIVFLRPPPFLPSARIDPSLLIQSQQTLALRNAELVNIVRALETNREMVPLLQQRIYNLELALTQANANIQHLQQAGQTGNLSLQASQNEIMRNRALIEALQKDKQAYFEQVQHCVALIKEANEQKSAATKALEQLKLERENAQAQTQNMQENTRQLQLLQQQLRDAQQATIQVSKDYQRAQGALQDSQQQLSQLQQQMNQMRQKPNSNEIDALNEKVQGLQRQLDQTRNSLDSTVQQNTNLRNATNLTDLQLKDTQKALQQCQRDVKDKENQLVQAQTTIRELRQQIQQLQPH